MPEEVGDQTDLLSSQLGGPAAMAQVGEDSVGSAAPSGGQPLANGTVRDTESGRDVALLPAQMLESPVPASAATPSSHEPRGTVSPYPNCTNQKL